jgi:hypothetical protein
MAARDVTWGIILTAASVIALVYEIANRGFYANAYRKLPPVVVKLESDGVHKLDGRNRPNTFEWAKVARGRACGAGDRHTPARRPHATLTERGK